LPAQERAAVGKDPPRPRWVPRYGIILITGANHYVALVRVSSRYLKGVPFPAYFRFGASRDWDRHILSWYVGSRPILQALMIIEGSPRTTNMEKYLIAAVLVVSIVAPVMAADVFYIIFDDALKGCTIATTEPSDKTHYKVLGKYNSKAEAEKAIGAMKEC
jgi:hypothetical protein